MRGFSRCGYVSRSAPRRLFHSSLMCIFGAVLVALFTGLLVLLVGCLVDSRAISANFRRPFALRSSSPGISGRLSINLAISGRAYCLAHLSACWFLVIFSCVIFCSWSAWFSTHCSLSLICGVRISARSSGCIGLVSCVCVRMAMTCVLSGHGSIADCCNFWHICFAPGNHTPSSHRWFVIIRMFLYMW